MQNRRLDIQQQMSQPHVFISHSSDDRDFVESHLIEPLRRNGIDVWFSPRAITTASEWESSIRDALEQSDWFLVALSPSAARPGNQDAGDAVWTHDAAPDAQRGECRNQFRREPSAISSGCSPLRVSVPEWISRRGHHRHKPRAGCFLRLWRRFSSQENKLFWVSSSGRSS